MKKGNPAMKTPDIKILNVRRETASGATGGSMLPAKNTIK